MVYNDRSASNPEWINTNILLVINTDKDKINIYSEDNSEFDLINTYKKFVDEKGNEKFRYSAIDEKGKKCEIIFWFFKDKTQNHIATLSVDYSDVKFIYRLKDNN